MLLQRSTEGVTQANGVTRSGAGSGVVEYAPALPTGRPELLTYVGQRHFVVAREVGSRRRGAVSRSIDERPREEAHRELAADQLRPAQRCVGPADRRLHP